MNDRAKSRIYSPADLSVAGFVIACICLSPAATWAESLREHVESLAREWGFRLEGKDRIGEENYSPVAARDPAERIDRLLTNYNFVLTRDAYGRIARLTIAGLRAPPPTGSRSAPIPLAQGAGGHYVDAVLTGPNGSPVPLRVMVDTGASTLVLPRSLAARLGFPDGDLTKVQVQTANGTADGELATLRSVRVGQAASNDIAVTFVEDGLLGGRRLLGMSFLERFRMTIDSRDGGVRLERRND